VRDLTESQMVDRMLKKPDEGYDGFEGTGIRAGVIKVGRTSRRSPSGRRRLPPAARAQQETGCRFCFHSCSGCRSKMLFAREHGARIEATYYCHVEADSGWKAARSQQRPSTWPNLRGRGGRCTSITSTSSSTPAADMIFLINYLEAHGYGDRILYSIDTNWEFDEAGRPWHEAEKQHRRRASAPMPTASRTHADAAGGRRLLQRVNRYLIGNPAAAVRGFRGRLRPWHQTVARRACKEIEVDFGMGS